MYQEIIALQPENSHRKKPRLSISEVAFHSEKSKLQRPTVKPQLKRKFSQINLKDILLTGLNANEPTTSDRNDANTDPEQQYVSKGMKRSKTMSKQKHYEINQNFIVKHLQNQANNFSQRSVGKSSQKIQPDSFLPSIFKNNQNDSKGIQIKYHKNDQNRKIQDDKKYVSLQLDNVMPINNKEAAVAFKKLRSESLIHLQNKLKLQRAKILSKNQDKQIQNSDEKSDDLPRANTDGVNPTFQKEVSPEKKQKKFYINNLSLQTPENHNQGLQKRNYILKFLEKHEKDLLPKSENRKNSYFNVMNPIEKEKANEKPNPKNFYSSQNLISKKIVFANPDQMHLRKVQMIGVKQGKEKINVKYESPSRKAKEGKVKKECINGWDFDSEYEEVIQASGEDFGMVL